MVSHAVGLVVPQSDYVVLLKNGEITVKGTPAEVLASPFANFTIEKEELSFKSDKEDHEFVASKQGSSLIDQEGKARGSIKWGTYRSYIMACGGWLFVTSVLAAFSFQVGADYLSNWWIEVWTDSYRSPTMYISNAMVDDPKYQFSAFNIQSAKSWNWEISEQSSDSLYYISIFGVSGLVELLALNLRFLVVFFYVDSIFWRNECFSNTTHPDIAGSTRFIASVF